MATEIAFPVEFHVPGTPVSLQASNRSRERWKAQVAEAAKAGLPETPWLTEPSIAVTVFHFPKAESLVDLDNIAKPILDALTALVYRDDRQVDRLLIQRFDAHHGDELSNPSPRLADALANGRPRVYIRIDDDQSRRAP